MCSKVSFLTILFASHFIYTQAANEISSFLEAADFNEGSALARVCESVVVVVVVAATSACVVADLALRKLPLVEHLRGELFEKAIG